jgi:bacteriorhodopsin
MMYKMTDGQFQLVYNVLSFSLASMMATTLFLWLKVYSVIPKLQTPVIISGLVTFIAAYHYMRIFNSWVAGYSYENLGVNETDPKLTGVPFNDAYRYMDWLLTVPMLLMEIVLVMNLTKEEASSKCWILGVVSALMIANGYPGELIIAQDQLNTRWFYWGLSMLPFLFIVYTLLVGLADATNKETDPAISKQIRQAQIVTVISWLTYPVVYVFPMLGMKGAQAVVAIQCGYCVSDIISKCGVGLIIYNITAAKSAGKEQSILG